jgi:hypothetical protein
MVKRSPQFNKGIDKSLFGVVGVWAGYSSGDEAGISHHAVGVDIQQNNGDSLSPESPEYAQCIDVVYAAEDDALLVLHDLIPFQASVITKMRQYIMQI